MTLRAVAFRLPFRSLASKIQAAARENSPSLWHTLGSLVDRNFAAIEQWTQSPEAFPNKRVFVLVPTADRTTASATFVDWPAGQVLSGTFTKRLDSTRLAVTVQASGYMTGAVADVDYGISVDGAAGVLVKNGGISSLAVRYDMGGAVEVANLSAGDHVIEVQARTSAGTLHADAGDQVTLTVEEVA